MSSSSGRRTNYSSPVALLNVINTLSNSGNIQQREIEKERLQFAFRECDEKLTKLLEEQHEHLKSTIQDFTGISSRIAASREKVKVVRENLLACKGLLRCKRDDLKKYWMEGMEYNEVLNLLDRIDQVKNVPEKIEKYKEQKYYLHATELLVMTVSLLEGSLSGVEALRHVRLDLQAKKKVEHEGLIEELHRHLYIHSGKKFNSHGRNLSGSLVGTSLTAVPSIWSKESGSSVTSGGGRFKKAHARSASRSLMLEQSLQSGGSSIKADQEIIEDLNTDPEMNSDNFMTLLVESLSLLGKIPEAVEAIKKRMKREMSLIIHRATSQVAERAGQTDELITQQNHPNLLLELLEVLFDKFRGVAQAHGVVLSAIHKLNNAESESNISSSEKGGSALYTIDEVWSEMQFALQVLLADYLDMQNTSSTQQAPTAFSESESDLSLFFAPRRRGGNSRDQRAPLFRFEGSSSAISMNAYIRERRQECMAGAGRPVTDDAYGEPLYNTKPQLLCKPNAKNITIVFCPVISFVKEVEAAISMREGMRCTLYGFITDYVKEIFVGQIQFEINEKLETATKGLEAFRYLVDASTLKTLGAHRPLLQSTVAIEHVMQDQKNLMHSIPSHATQFLEMVCKILTSYKDGCNTAYKGLLRYFGDSDKPTRIISASWAKDEDISRLLRSLPNWQNLQQHTHRHTSKHEEDEDVEGVRKRNARESELLIGNLGDKEGYLVNKAEVVLDLGDLKTLANLQESLEWLSTRIRTLSTSLTAQSTAISLVTTESKERIKSLNRRQKEVFYDGCMFIVGKNWQDIPPVPEDVLKSLTSLAREYQNMCESCLLVLHLEIRCHCLFYLLPAVRQSSYVCGMDALDPDQMVINLNKDLSSLEEISAASLAHHKFRYLFEGLGHLLSSILISNLAHIKRINMNGIKKIYHAVQCSELRMQNKRCRNIFSLQQNLTNITMSREADLDHARQYYELLYLNPDEILTVVVEQGAKFTELEYLNLLNLQWRSQTVRDEAVIKQRQKRLKEILRESTH